MKRCPQCNRLENDEALKFCRVDGATLVNDSSLSSEAGTAQLVSGQVVNEIQTSILPHTTDTDIRRATGPTTALAATSGKPKNYKAVVAIGIIAIITIVAT